MQHPSSQDMTQGRSVMKVLKPMVQRLKNKRLHNMIMYAIATVLQKGIAFFLLPLYTSRLIPSEYGIVNLVIGVCSFYGILITLGMDAAAGRYYILLLDKEEERKRFLGTIVYFVMLEGLIAAAVLLILHKSLLMPFAEGATFFPHLLLGVIYIVMMPLYAIYQRILLMKEDAKRYSTNLISNFVVQASLSILFILGLKMQSSGYILAMCITSCIYFAIALFGLRKEMVRCFEKASLKKAVSYALPLVPHTLSNWINAVFDKIVIAKTSGLWDVGIYNIGNQFGMITNILASAVNQAYIPWLYKKLKDDKKAIIRSSELLTALFSVMGIIVTFFARPVLGIMVDKSYSEALKIMPYLILAYSFTNIYLVFINIVIYDTHWSKYISFITLSCAGVNVILNLALIPVWGMYGAAWSSISTKGVTCILVIIMAGRSSGIPFRWGRIFFWICLMTVGCLIQIKM